MGMKPGGVEGEKRERRMRISAGQKMHQEEVKEEEEEQGGKKEDEEERETKVPNFNGPKFKNILSPSNAEYNNEEANKQQVRSCVQAIFVQASLLISVRVLL